MRLAVVELQPRAGWSAPLEPGALIGRGKACDLRLLDVLVSRRHARVCECGGDTAIEDLGSRNGVYVNGRRRSGVVSLRVGDRVCLGATTWLVIAAGDGCGRPLQ